MVHSKKSTGISNGVHAMRKLLVIAADQEKIGSEPGPHTLKKEHEERLHKTLDGELNVAVATPEEAEAHFADAEIIAAFPMRVPDIAKTPQVKWLHSFSAGVDKILTPEVAASSVFLSNSSGIHATPIAEHIIGYLLMFTRGLIKTFRNQISRVYEKDQTLREVRDAEILIVGLGEIGRETARLAKSFGARVTAVSRSGKNRPDFVDVLEVSDKLDTLLGTADFVVITLPHTEETHYLFDREKIRRMKKSAVIINIGRGGIIKEVDLIDALNAGEIAGAALDVFEKEPLPKESPLWDFENVIITPHHSGLSHRYMDRATELLIKNVDAYLKGEPLPNLVDKKLGY
ncbi:D-2-hydroxyacid dehydrogenase [Candidatus Parcubacteria bacterium]|nr:MAG: D-2-hydroxyacid dehydrogenase [Candidatus Parcubacteria bacterium]